MKLAMLAEGLDYTLLQGSLDTDITDVRYDTRAIIGGEIFVCIEGYTRDSHDMAADAIAKGARALLIQHDLPELPAGCAVLKVADTKEGLALLSANLFGHPAEKMTMIGVTGTKGKTTTAHMIRSVLTAAGRKVGLVGTIGVEYPGFFAELPNTTPQSYDLQKYFADMVAAGCDALVMEVSSQGMMNQRVAGIHYDVGVFTNLYMDHVGGPGEHKTFEEYRAWKGELFKRCDVGVVNVDDPNTALLLEGHTCELVGYGMDERADFRAKDLQLVRAENFLGIHFAVEGREQMNVKVNMPGAFSVYNSLAAIAVGRVLGLPHAAIHDGLMNISVKGRVEMVPISKKFTILIDFAHNEASTESLLTTLKAYDPGRIVCLFGCGGNRSRERRYGMGEVASKLADFLILTEDNNRFEAIEDIIADIRTGIAKGRADVPAVEIHDREEAIHYAIDHAEEGDLICVIGKGHETYRDRQGVKTPFLEREIIEAYAARIGLE